MKPLKVVAVGDGMVGKTCLLITYIQNAFPAEYDPTVFDNYLTTIIVDDTEYKLMLWDTAGQEDYEKLRPLSYPSTDCFLVCYSIASRESFANVLSKWYPEVKHYAPHTPIILVGTKMDLRVPNSEKYVTTAEANKLKSKIRAYAFLECSAKKKSSLEDVFIQAVRAVERKQVVKSSACQLF